MLWLPQSNGAHTTSTDYIMFVLRGNEIIFLFLFFVSVAPAVRRACKPKPQINFVLSFNAIRITCFVYDRIIDRMYSSIQCGLVWQVRWAAIRRANHTTSFVRQTAGGDAENIHISQIGSHVIHSTLSHWQLSAAETELTALLHSPHKFCLFILVETNPVHHADGTNFKVKVFRFHWIA